MMMMTLLLKTIGHFFRRQSTRKSGRSISRLDWECEQLEVRNLLSGTSFDVDRDGDAEPLSDGIVIIRYLAGFRGDALVLGVVNAFGQQPGADSIAQCLDSARNTFLDPDGDGQQLPLSDGVVVLRSMAGFTGSALVDGAINPNGSRVEPGVITSYLEDFRPPRADLILHNGRIYTVDESLPWAEAVAVHDGEILFVGSNQDVQRFVNESTQSIDLQGKTVLPGFHDVHTHILEAFSSVNTVSLDPETPLRELLPRLRGQQPHPATGWVLGGGQTIEVFFDLEENPKEILDEAIPDVPAAMLEMTSHSIWVNSAALAAAGIDSDTPDPPGGIIDRDPLTGEPSGLLIDSAVDLILDVALARNAALDELNYQGLLEGLEFLNGFGVTSVADARVYQGRGHLDVWRRAEIDGTIRVRANLGLWASPYADDTQQIADLTALFSDDPNSFVNVNEIKLYSDGITGNGTAAFVDAYKQEVFAGPNGLKYFETARLAQYITQLEQVGFTFNIHAIGDAGVRDALTAIEQAGLTNSGLDDRRHRLTHVESVHPDDIGRFAELGVIADIQVSGDILLPTNREFLRELIGDRADHLLPVRDLHDAGATVVFSSDFDVNSPNPFVGIERSLTRTDGQSLPGVADAIAAYTINAAFAMRQDSLVGSIEVGKLADMIIINQDIFTIPTTQIDQTKVLLTLLAGQEVYRDSSFTS